MTGSEREGLVKGTNYKLSTLQYYSAVYTYQTVRGRLDVAHMKTFTKSTMCAVYFSRKVQSVLCTICTTCTVYRALHSAAPWGLALVSPGLVGAGFKRISPPRELASESAYIKITRDRSVSP